MHSHDFQFGARCPKRFAHPIADAFQEQVFDHGNESLPFAGISASV
jgi:hypothetical protein